MIRNGHGRCFAAAPRARTILAAVALIAGIVLANGSRAEPPPPGADPWWDSLAGKQGHVSGNLTPRFTVPKPGDDDDRAGGPPPNAPPTIGGPPAGPGPLDPGTLDPAEPRIAALIIEWMRIAEPPPNATEGARFRYSSRGAMIGTTWDGGIIKAPHDPVTPDPVWLWRNQRGLDSVDHCTMEEYVVARAGGTPPSGCAGRYVGAVADMTGQPPERARKRIAAFRYRLDEKVGDPAPSIELSGTVERQQPDPGTKLRRGGLVTLWIHTPALDERTVPDLTALAGEEARDRIEEADLRARITPGEPAASAADDGRVASQEPEPGTKVKAGSEVLVTVFAPFVDRRTVPDIAGLASRQAVDRIEQAGLVARIQSGEPAASPDDTGKVADQEPTAGTELEPGAEVLVTVFAPFVDRRTVPDLAGLTSRQARDRVEQAGLVARVRPGEPAESPDDTGKVAGQEPAAGARLEPGALVVVTVFAPFADQRTVPDLTGLTSRQARERIEQAGLTATVRPGQAAASPEDTGKVARQEPAAGAKLRAGTEVTIIVFAPFADQSMVPDVTGLTSRQARDRIEQAGLTASIKPGRPAESAENAGKVASQAPAAGARVKPGSPVIVTVFTPTVETREVPNLVGLTFEEAQRRLTSARLTVERREAGTPSSRGDAHRIASQQPAAGTRVKPGSRVVVGVLGAYTPSREEQVAALDCTPWPNSEAYWSEEQSQPRCRCIQGFKWGESEQACVGGRPLGGEQATTSYFVGLWALDKNACSGRVPPPRPSTESGSAGLGDIGTAIGEAIGEAIEQAFATMGMSFAADGTYAWVNIPTGETARLGTWSYHDGIISLRGSLDEQSDADGDGRVLEQHPDRFVMQDTARGDVVTLWRCSSTPAAGGAAGGQPQTGQNCYALTDRLRGQIESRAIGGRQAEQQLLQAGCGDEINEMCPSGTFGQTEWPQCLSATGYQY